MLGRCLQVIYFSWRTLTDHCWQPTRPWPWSYAWTSRMQSLWEKHFSNANVVKLKSIKMVTAARLGIKAPRADSTLRALDQWNEAECSVVTCLLKWHFWVPALWYLCLKTSHCWESTRPQEGRHWGSTWPPFSRWRRRKLGKSVEDPKERLEHLFCSNVSRRLRLASKCAPARIFFRFCHQIGEDNNKVRVRVSITTKRILPQDQPQLLKEHSYKCGGLGSPHCRLLWFGERTDSPVAPDLASPRKSPWCWGRIGASDRVRRWAWSRWRREWCGSLFDAARSRSYDGVFAAGRYFPSV